jgi:hypothetical protein
VVDVEATRWRQKKKKNVKQNRRVLFVYFTVTISEDRICKYFLSDKISLKSSSRGSDVGFNLDVGK